MVATRLWEVTTKGKEWAYGGQDETDQPTMPSPNENNRRDSYWDYASSSVQSAAESTYSTLAGMISSIYTGSTASSPTMLERIDSPVDDIEELRSPSQRRSTLGSRRYSTQDLAYMLKNPYSSVRGRHDQPSSMSAVRALLNLVPFVDDDIPRLQAVPEEESMYEPITPSGESVMEASWSETDMSTRKGSFYRRKPVSDAETASQVAEGTIRALRDLALDEAVELHVSLRYWSERWERPVLSWLEAGPRAWLSKDGYNHQAVGQKVAQIQAVLARRCATIGELQQHLLRAGWQRGVAQWGVLGQGAQWAAVAGFDGSIAENAIPLHRTMSSDIGDVRPLDRDTRMLDQSVSSMSETSDNVKDLAQQLPRPSSRIGLADHQSTKPDRGQYRASIMVRNRDGGGIFVDDPGFLAEWSVDAISLVRGQLRRAANGLLPLPFETNWRKELLSHPDTQGELIVSEPEALRRAKMPQWAIEIPKSQKDPIENGPSTPDSIENNPETRICISDMPLMVMEVSELLNIMEDIMAIQRRRRLDKLRPPGRLRRNWYILATVVPSITFLFYRIDAFVRRTYGKDLVKFLAHGISRFFNEHVRGPVVAIVNELLKGRQSVSDNKARKEVIDTLKKMLRAWLDDYYPQMPEEERSAMAEAMDVTLIEQTKEESMKTFYEINNVVRMSFIEMQYMKKEMMNALNAMDEMMSANDINMNLAAITPFVIFTYVQARIFRFCYYALLKLGKSREETYAQFRNILTDIERLLVMRDNPPSSPPRANQPSLDGSQDGEQTVKPCVLGPDDLGMLMLLIHECRTILWQDRQRFPADMTRSVSEDLAELAGERGAVSVQQQLHIIGRMSRTYPFLKVMSTGHTFQYSRLRTAD